MFAAPFCAEFQAEQRRFAHIKQDVYRQQCYVSDGKLIHPRAVYFLAVIKNGGDRLGVPQVRLADKSGDLFNIGFGRGTAENGQIVRKGQYDFCRFLRDSDGCITVSVQNDIA